MLEREDRSRLQSAVEGVVDLEDPIELGNLQQTQDLLVNADKPHDAAVLAHCALCNQKCAQAAAVARIDLPHVDDEFLGYLRLAEDEKFGLQLPGHKGVELSLPQRDNGRYTVLCNLKLHFGPLLLEHVQQIDKSSVDGLRRTGAVEIQLDVVECIAVFSSYPNSNGRAGRFANIRSVKYEVKVKIDCKIVRVGDDAVHDVVSREEEGIEVNLVNANHFRATIAERCCPNARCYDRNVGVCCPAEQPLECRTGHICILVAHRQDDEDAACAAEEFRQGLVVVPVGAKPPPGISEAEPCSDLT